MDGGCECTTGHWPSSPRGSRRYTHNGACILTCSKGNPSLGLPQHAVRRTQQPQSHVATLRIYVGATASQHDRCSLAWLARRLLLFPENIIQQSEGRCFISANTDTRANRATPDRSACRATRPA